MATQISAILLNIISHIVYIINEEYCSIWLQQVHMWRFVWISVTEMPMPLLALE